MLQSRNYTMSHDRQDALPPAVRRASTAPLEPPRLQQHQQFLRFDFCGSDDSDVDDADAIDDAGDADDADDAIPPSIARSRSHSLSTQLPTRPSSHDGPPAILNPLRAHPVNPVVPIELSQRISHPFRARAESFELLPPVPQRRNSRGLHSYRDNKKIPLHLRQQPSLETIASVTTTASLDYYDPPEAEAPCPDFFASEDDGHTLSTKTASLHAYSSNTSSGSSRQSSTLAEPPLEHTSLPPHPPQSQSIFRKIMPRKPEEASRLPTRLIIEREITIDRTYTSSALSPEFSDSSTPSLPPRQSLDSGLNNTEERNSQSSSEWSASGFDTSTLTEAEIKKCKKKGINPALYAEMRAAKKGKWISPITGTSFL
ncbi:hypothetical protein J1614_004001 [Plenodomus biglobosus]|nr:hypothetical protein J1614_004001 [Plenodomus biglobosus]